MACISKKENGEQYGFKRVPESVEEITAEWCEKALKIGNYKPMISQDTKVDSVEVTRLQNEITGVMDGGGFSGSTLLRINLKYGGNTTGDEPKSIICKISLGSDIKWDLFWRFVMYTQNGGGFDEVVMRNELSFLQNAIPLMEGTDYRHPKIYYVGSNDKKERGFMTAVIFNTPTKVKTVILMEDMKGYRSSAVGVILEKEDAILCMKNVAVLHAKFWGDKEKETKLKFRPANTEVQYRGSKYSKMNKYMRDQKICSSQKVKSQIEKGMSNEWRTCEMMTFKIDAKKPPWFRAEPLENDSFAVLDDPIVKEMLDVFSNRVPEYNRKSLQPYFEKQSQTLLHGDFHAGNHMYGEEEKEGDIVAIDFQLTGTGLAVFDFCYLIMMSLSVHSFQDLMDILKEYHDQLTFQGVNDYTWSELEKDFECAMVELIMVITSMFGMMKPKTIMKMTEGWGEKSEDAKKIFGNGMYAKAFIIVTDIYLKDKDNFMI